MLRLACVSALASALLCVIRAERRRVVERRRSRTTRASNTPNGPITCGKPLESREAERGEVHDLRRLAHAAGDVGEQGREIALALALAVARSRTAAARPRGCDRARASMASASDSWIVVAVAVPDRHAVQEHVGRPRLDCARALAEPSASAPKSERHPSCRHETFNPFRRSAVPHATVSCRAPPTQPFSRCCPRP